jgi:hypothetical protein
LRLLQVAQPLEHHLRLLKQNLHHYTATPIAKDENHVQTMVIIHPNSVSASERPSDLKQTLVSLPNPLVEIPSRYTDFTCIPEALLNPEIFILLVLLHAPKHTATDFPVLVQ